MGRVINTVDGSMTVISNQDVFDYIRNKCGNEVANFIECIASDMEENTVYEEMKFNSDFSAIESENSDMSIAINNSRQLLEILLNYVSATGKLNRSKLSEMIMEISEELSV